METATRIRIRTTVSFSDLKKPYRRTVQRRDAGLWYFLSGSVIHRPVDASALLGLPEPEVPKAEPNKHSERCSQECPADDNEYRREWRELRQPPRAAAILSVPLCPICRAPADGICSACNDAFSSRQFLAPICSADAPPVVDPYPGLRAGIATR